MEELEKQINGHQCNLIEISKNISKEKGTDKIIKLSQELNNEKIIIESLIKVKESLLKNCEYLKDKTNSKSKKDEINIGKENEETKNKKDNSIKEKRENNNIKKLKKRVKN